MIPPPPETPPTPGTAPVSFPVPDASGLSLHPHARPLGQTGLQLSPLGLSGHYGLPEEGFAHALDAGVNLFFWEPNYNTQTRFFQALSPHDPEQLAHNLQVLDDPSLPTERQQQLRAFGDLVYQKNRMFADCVRNR